MRDHLWLFKRILPFELLYFPRNSQRKKYLRNTKDASLISDRAAHPWTNDEDESRIMCSLKLWWIDENVFLQWQQYFETFVARRLTTSSQRKSIFFDSDHRENQYWLHFYDDHASSQRAIDQLSLSAIERSSFRSLNGDRGREESNSSAHSSREDHFCFFVPSFKNFLPIIAV